MEQVLHQQIASAAANIESQLDDQINALDSMTSDELKTLRNQRLNELKNEAKKKQEWLNNGHGEYDELQGEKEFFEISKKSANIIAHFYRDATERCKIVDHHLKILAKKHIEAKFCKVNAENSPFLTQRLRIKVIPTIAIIKDSKTKDYIVGFTDLGNRDDFTTEMMEWRIAQSGAINYNVSWLSIAFRNFQWNNQYCELIIFAVFLGWFANATGTSAQREKDAETTEEDHTW